MLFYTLSYSIMFCHGVHHFTANRKESSSLPVAASYRDLQSLLIFVMIFIISVHEKSQLHVGCGYYRHIQNLTVIYHHSNSVTYISSCKHIKEL